MKSFTNIKSVIASLKLNNIDTDMIIPKQFLKTIKRTGLGCKLFFEMRYIDNNESNKNTNFVLNKTPFDKAQILLCGENFGCGSSREHAPWSLSDFGIKCIIAQSFADIFYNNCFENRILPIILTKDSIDKIDEFAQNGEIFDIDLENQSIKSQNIDIKFEIDSFKKDKLLKGLDSIGATIAKLDKIKQFEEKQKNQNPWLWSDN